MEEEKKEAGDRKLIEAASKIAKTVSTKNPWRAILSWWFSVKQVKFKSSSESKLTVYMNKKWFSFPQFNHKMKESRIQAFYEQTTKEERNAQLELFMKEFYNVIWVSYRRNITGMKQKPSCSIFTSDAGWGCMIRATQMLLANCLIQHVFPDGSFSISLVEKDTKARLKYLGVLKTIFDCLNGAEAAFSIGNIVELGPKYDRRIGQWFGPSMMTQILQELNEKYRPYSDLRIAAFPEGVIYKDKLLKIAKSTVWTSTIVFVSYRLGLTKLNPDYHAGILRLFQFTSFVGMTGGQGNSALYFVGFQNSELLFLDPHVTQDSIESVEKLWEEHLTYHYSNPLKLPLIKLDTCVSFGFYLRTEEDYLTFLKEIKSEISEPNSFIQISEKEIDYEDIEPIQEVSVTVGKDGKSDVFIIYQLL